MKFSVNGLDAFAYTGGRRFEDGNETIVFIHGGGLDHTVWIMQSRYFAHHGRNVLAVDLPGHGRSEGAPPKSVADMADWIHDALDALGVERAALVGHSMGSLVALNAVARRPERSWLLGLLGMSVPMPVHERLLSAANDNDHWAFDMVNIWGHGRAAQIGGNQAPGMWMTGGAVRLLERSGPGVLHNDLEACNRYHEGVEDASQVVCPVLVLVGLRDIMATPARARPVIEALAHLARVQVTELDCGHMLMAERPTEVLDALIETVDEHAPGASARP